MNSYKIQYKEAGKLIKETIKAEKALTCAIIVGTSSRSLPITCEPSQADEAQKARQMVRRAKRNITLDSTPERDYGIFMHSEARERRLGR